MNPAKPGVAKIQRKNSFETLTEDLIVPQIIQAEHKRQTRDLTTAAATDPENMRRGSAQTPAAANHAKMLAEHPA